MMKCDINIVRDLTVLYTYLSETSAMTGEEKSLLNWWYNDFKKNYGDFWDDNLTLVVSGFSSDSNVGSFKRCRLPKPYLLTLPKGLLTVLPPHHEKWPTPIFFWLEPIVMHPLIFQVSRNISSPGSEVIRFPHEVRPEAISIANDSRHQAGWDPGTCSITNYLLSTQKSKWKKKN